ARGTRPRAGSPPRRPQLGCPCLARPHVQADPCTGDVRGLWRHRGETVELTSRDLCRGDRADAGRRGRAARAPADRRNDEIRAGAHLADSEPRYHGPSGGDGEPGRRPSDVDPTVSPGVDMSRTFHRLFATATAAILVALGILASTASATQPPSVMAALGDSIT